MQVDSAAVATSSPLSSLVSSSVPSIEPARPVAGARAKVTYSRKPLAPENEASSSSSQPTSPSDNLFDSPMRSYGRNAASLLDHDDNDVTITNEISPATTAPAGNSAVKIGASSLFRRVDSHNSHQSQDDDQHDHQQSSTESPALNRTKKFQFGAARAIFDSDSDSDGDITSKLTSRPLAANDDQNDDEVIARIRAQQARDADSDPFTGSLSSVPPSSSQAQSSLQRSFHDSADEHMADDDQDTGATVSRPRGGRISAMRGKGGKPSRSKFSESSDKEPSAGSDADDDEVQARKPRTFKLVSSASSASATPANHDASVDKEPALTRRDKLAALAARARKAHGDADAEAEASTEADPLLDAFFGGGSPGRIPSRSPSLDIQGSDEDEHNDAMPAFMAPTSKSATAKTKAKKSKKSAPVERDILDDPQDDRKHVSKRATATKEKAPPKIKPLSKKEMDAMNKQTARLARENRTRLAPTHQKKTIGLNELLSKISAGEAFRSHGSQAANTSNSGDATASDSSAQPSSQIPSGQSKSQHASDPIESDPIPERSSPHPAYSSSPVLPVSRQQERRLGLDQSSSNANILQNSAAGRVGGLATKQGSNAQMLHQHLLADAEDHDDARLPDLASIVKQSRDQQEADKETARKKQHLLEMKLRLLEKSRQQASASKDAVSKTDDTDAADQDDLELYTPGSVLAAKHNILTTPAKKRPTDQLYREIGIRPGKTPPSRKSYTGTNANGSPSADRQGADHIEMADGHDELLVTDSQLRNAGKGLFVASDKAAGQTPATQPPPVSTQASAQPSRRQAAPRSGPLKLTQAELNAKLMRQMQSQSLKARSQKDAKEASAKAAAGSVVDKYGRSAAPDVQAMLQRLGETANDQVLDQDDKADEDEDDPDYIMPPARNAESAVGSDVDMGSASEIDENDDFIDMGSADEDDENMDVQEAGTRDTIEEADEEHDSEKENAPPPASQQSQRSNASPSLSRSLLPSRAVMDDDEDELPAARPHARRGRRSALADDDDADDETALQPGPFDRNRSSVQADEASQSQGRSRVPLGDISSQSIDQSMPFSRSNTTSPAMQHATAPRRDSLVVPLSAGHDEDESFRTDDIPSQAASLGRFFEPTMPPPPTAKSALVASSAPKSFWDQTQTQDETQDASQLPSSVRPPARPLARDESANSALGAFFQDTQQDSLRGESLDIFDNPKTAGGKAPGFTQFFFDGTPPPSASAKWDASTMPPPKSTDVDAFAALRKAQMSDAMGLLEPTPSVLPSFDESQAEREAYAAMGQNASPEKMYMNRDGFFTQTKPSTQAGLWSQYDSQSQSQSQHRGGVTQSPALRRGSDISNAGEQGVSIFDDEEDDAPKQLKRLRRGARFADEEVVHQPEASEAGSDMDEDAGPPSSQPEPRPRNAFDVLREGPIAEDDGVRSKKRKSAFIEGEAEESEDEELNPKRGDAGGLKGVFGDDGESSGAEEDSEDDADAADLTELVDNERDLDEAAKDEIARARFREDMDARDREDLEIHQKAIQGGYRNRRRGVGLNGIEGFLDDDADDEELKRRAAMGGAAAWKKRKLLDGTEDGMDKLAAHEEAHAFVQGYAATHRVDHESEKYDFLTMDVQGDDGEESDEEEEEEEDVVEEDAFGPVVGQPKTIGYSDVARKVRESRRAGKCAVSEDEDERRDNDWDSDEDADEALAVAMRDRTKASAPSRPIPSKRPQGAQYGRKSRPDPVAQHTEEPMEDDPEEEEGGSLMARLLTRPTQAKTLETLDDAEPEWGNDAGIVRAPKPAASGTSQSSSGSKLAMGTGMKTGGGEKRRMGSMLLGKQIMRRESGFSSSSGGER